MAPTGKVLLSEMEEYFDSKFLNSYTLTSVGSYFVIEVELVYAIKNPDSDTVSMERTVRDYKIQALDPPLSVSKVYEIRDSLLQLEDTGDIACLNCIKPYYRNKKTGEFFCPSCDS